MNLDKVFSASLLQEGGRQIALVRQQIQRKVFNMFTSSSAYEYLSTVLQEGRISQEERDYIKERLEAVVQRLPVEQLPRPRCRTQLEQTKKLRSSNEFLTNLLESKPNEHTQKRMKQLRKESQQRALRINKLEERINSQLNLIRQNMNAKAQEQLCKKQTLSRSKALKLQSIRDQRKKSTQEYQKSVCEQNKALQQKLKQLSRLKGKNYEQQVKRFKTLQEMQRKDVQKRLSDRRDHNFVQKIDQFQENYLEIRKQKNQNSRTHSKQSQLRQSNKRYFKGRFHQLVDNQVSRYQTQQLRLQEKKVRILKASEFNKKILQQLVKVQEKDLISKAAPVQAPQAFEQDVRHDNYMHKVRLRSIGDDYLKLQRHIKKNSTPAVIPEPKKATKKDYLRQNIFRKAQRREIRIGSLDRVGVQRFLTQTQKIQEKATRLEQLIKHSGNAQSRYAQLSELFCKSVNAKLELIKHFL